MEQEKSQNTLEYLVVGTGRSGTVYYSKLLTSLGIPCGHESFFNYQGIDAALARLSGRLPPTLSGCSQLRFDGKRHQYSPPHVSLKNLVAESSYMAVPYLGHSCLAGTKVIHVVRHPVHVVNSFVNYLRYFRTPPQSTPPGLIYECFIYNHMPELLDYRMPYERAAMYYVLWNQLIETVKAPRLKVEDGPGVLRKLLGVNTGKAFDDRRTNTFECAGDRFDVSMLPDGEVKRRFISVGESYGYNMSSYHLLI